MHTHTHTQKKTNTTTHITTHTHIQTHTHTTSHTHTHTQNNAQPHAHTYNQAHNHTHTHIQTHTTTRPHPQIYLIPNGEDPHWSCRDEAKRTFMATSLSSDSFHTTESSSLGPELDPVWKNNRKNKLPGLSPVVGLNPSRSPEEGTVSQRFLLRSVHDSAASGTKTDRKTLKNLRCLSLDQQDVMDDAVRPLLWLRMGSRAPQCPLTSGWTSHSGRQ